jgi:hypothetical protein
MMITVSFIFAAVLLIGFLWLVLDVDRFVRLINWLLFCAVLALMGLAAWALFVFATNYRG